MTDWKKLMVSELSRALNDEHEFTAIWDYLLEIKDFIYTFAGGLMSLLLTMF